MISPSRGWSRCAVSAMVLAGLGVGAVQSFAQGYPLPRQENTAAYGNRIQRTMHLMATSTPQRRNTVRIMAYGQSWTHQDWCRQLAAWLRETYPFVDFEFLNRAIGGCASSCLQRPAPLDIHPFYPDLLIFHVGNSGNDSYEAIVAGAREHTATELLIWNDYYPAGSNATASFQKDYIAPKYHAELVDSWQQFQDYLRDNSIGQGELHDGHLTEQGSFVLAELIKAHFVYKTELDPDPDTLMLRYHVGTDARFEGGTLTLPFAGNRIDVVFDEQAAGTFAAARVLVNDRAPSSYPGCYAASKPNGDRACNWFEETCWHNDKDWPWGAGGIYNMTWSAVPPVGEYVVTVKNLNSANKYFDFDLTIDGVLDGSGNNQSVYRGSVTIQPQDWALPTSDYWIDAYNVRVQNGYTVTWNVERRHVDTLRPPSQFSANKETIVTLAQGLPNTDHTLELTAIGGGAVPIKAFHVYRPLWNRAPTHVPLPGTVAVRAPGVARAAFAAPTGGTQHFDLRGRSIAPHGQRTRVGVCMVREKGRAVSLWVATGGAGSVP